MEHARRLEAKAKADWSAHVAANFDAIVTGLEPEARAKVAAVRAAGDQLAAALSDWLVLHGRSVGLTEPVPGVNGQHVPDAGPIVGMKRSVENLDLPLPLPTP